MPAMINADTIESGSLGRLLITKRRCGCKNTKTRQKAVKYNIYGVKIEKSIATAKNNEYIGFGLFSPWIFEPSQSKSVGQNTIIISGVPFPAKNKNGVDKTTRQDARSDTLLLNQRFSKRISSKPRNRPTMILGSLIAYGVKPNSMIDTFCSARYGISTKSPFSGASNSSA